MPADTDFFSSQRDCANTHQTTATLADFNTRVTRIMCSVPFTSDTQNQKSPKLYFKIHLKVWMLRIAIFSSQLSQVIH